VDAKSEYTVNIICMWAGVRKSVKISGDETVTSWRRKLSNAQYSGLGFSMTSKSWMVMLPNGKELRTLKAKILDHFSENDTIMLNHRR
jgi:hypothetical protein